MSGQSSSAGSESRENRRYIAIDMKSFYASVECVYRNLDPLKANLLVADETRSDQTICLAVSPSLKAKGVPSRPRLFEAKQAIREYELRYHTRVPYLIAPPRMAEYEKVSANIYATYLQFASPDDIHVYSIDECFIDCTGYLHEYRKPKYGNPENPAWAMAVQMVRAVLARTGITATVGIGTNLYLAKVAMDIVAKKAPPDKDGVRIAELNETSYIFSLWEHRPLTDFWMIGPGKARTLNKAGMFTLGDVAARVQIDEEWFYKKFGVDAEILIDHVWGIEPTTMKDIKSYKPDTHSISNGQVLPRPYHYEEARLVLKEMIEVLTSDMFSRSVLSRTFVWWVSYDYKSMDEVPSYEGPVSVDFYGRLHPSHSKGTVRMEVPTSQFQVVADAVLHQFDARTDHRLLYRRLGVSAQNIVEDSGEIQLNLFQDWRDVEKEQRLRTAIQDIRQRFGPNALFRGMNLVEGATTLERNQQIGGHRA